MTNDKFISKAAKALGDRNRLLIFKEIARQGSLTITQAQQLTNLAQPSISHHVKLLTDSELVDANKEGRSVHLRINQERITYFMDFFAHLEPKAAPADQSIPQREA